MNIKIGTYNLAGQDWNEKVSGLKMSVQRNVVVQPHFRADYPDIQAGDNETTTIGFQVARLHADYRTATAFLLDHPASVPRRGRVTIEQDTDSGIVRRYFVASSCQSFDGDLIGVTTIFRYQIIGTRLYSTEAQALALSRKSTRAGTGSPTGATGVSGSTGTSDSSGPTTMRKDFLTPSNEWRWTHNLGYWPEVEAFNTDGVKLVASITNEDLNTVVATHAASISGYLVITL